MNQTDEPAPIPMPGDIGPQPGGSGGEGEYVVSGVTSSGIVLDSASMTILDGGVADGTVVNRGGVMFVSNGGTADGTVMSGGSMFVTEGGLADRTVMSGGSVIDSSGETPHVITYFSANLTVFGGGTADRTTLIAGSLTVLSGGSADNTVMSGGSMLVSGGGAADDTVLSGGRLEISGDGAANGIEVNAGGRLIVSGSGTAVGISENGGYVEFADDASVTFSANTIAGLTLTDLATVHSGTTATGTTVAGGGCLFLLGGDATGTTVASGGLLSISGGTADGISVDAGGTLIVSPGGRLTGQMAFGGGAVVSAASGAILDFDLTQDRPASSALVNDLSAVAGAPSFVLTVDADRMNGDDCLLAGGAAGFAGTLSVTNRNGDDLGSLSEGGMILFGETYYTLNLDGAELVLKAKGLEDGPDGGWNDYVYDRTLGYNEDNIDRFRNTTPGEGVTAVPLDEKSTICRNGKRNFVGKDDPADYAKLTLEHAASLSFDLTATDAAKFTVWLLDVGEKNGEPTYRMKSLQSTSLKKQKNGGEFAATTANLLLEKGVYYVSMEPGDRKAEEVFYNVELGADTKIYSDGDDGSNNYLYDKKRTDKPLNTDVTESEGVAVNGATDGIRVDRETVSPEYANFVGFGDSIDYGKITLEHAAGLVFRLAATDAAKFTVWFLETGEKNGESTYKTKSLQTTSLKKQKNGTETAVTTKELRLEAGVYYISMEAVNAAKGAEAYYDVSLVTTGDAASTFYDDGDNGWNNYVYDKKLGYNAENVDRFVVTEIAAGTPEAEPGAHIMLELDAVPVNEEWDNFVGFGDTADYAKITVAAGTTLSFSLTAADAAKFTVWALETGEKKGETTYRMKSLQTTSLKKDGATGLYRKDTKEYTFREGGTYFISMESANAKKGSFTYYDVELKSAVFSGGNAAALDMPDGFGGFGTNAADTPAPAPYAQDGAADISAVGAIDSQGDRSFLQTPLLA